MEGLHGLLKELVVFYILRMRVEAKVTLLSLNFPLNTTVTHYFCRRGRADMLAHRHLAGMRCKKESYYTGNFVVNGPLLKLTNAQTRPEGPNRCGEEPDPGT